jgi:hypothetical protein
MSRFMINISGGRMLQSYVVFPFWEDIFDNFRPYAGSIGVIFTI